MEIMNKSIIENKKPWMHWTSARLCYEKLPWVSGGEADSFCGKLLLPHISLSEKSKNIRDNNYCWTSVDLMS